MIRGTRRANVVVVVVVMVIVTIEIKQAPGENETTRGK